MDSSIIIAGVGIVAALAPMGYLLLYAKSQSRARTWREAARAIGMADVVESGALGMRTGLEGRAEGLSVRIEPTAGGGARVVVRGLGHPSWEQPARFLARTEGVESAFSKALGRGEVTVGDEPFDALVHIQGTPRAVLAILDAEARALLRGLLQRRGGSSNEAPRPQVEFVDGVLRVDVPQRTDLVASSQISTEVEQVMTLARKLALPDDLPSRLARNVNEDPVPGVRLANLAALLQEYPHEIVTREALQLACRNEDAEVRLRAAVALGPEMAGDVLKELASFPDGRRGLRFGGDGAADSRAERAIGALGVSLSVPEAGELLDRSLAHRRPAAARASIDVLARHGGSEAVSILCRHLQNLDPDIAAAAARGLGEAGGEGAESALIAALKCEAPLVRRAAAAALGRCGSAAAVKPLKDLSGPLNLGPAARQAIAEIQSRLTGASPGQLALADGVSGQLSLSNEGLEGRVAMVTQAEASTEGESQWPTDAREGDPPAEEGGHAEDDESADTSPAPPPKTEAE